MQPKSRGYEPLRCSQRLVECGGGAVSDAEMVCAGQRRVLLLGSANYAWTYFHGGRLTNGSTLMWRAALIVFLIGLVSEQISNLTYKRDG